MKMIATDKRRKDYLRESNGACVFNSVLSEPPGVEAPEPGTSLSTPRTLQSLGDISIMPRSGPLLQRDTNTDATLPKSDSPEISPVPNDQKPPDDAGALIQTNDSQSSTVIQDPPAVKLATFSGATLANNGYRGGITA